MRVSEISKRYAKALFAVTKQKGTHLQTFAELNALAQSIGRDQQVLSYFENPVISSEQKTDTLKTVIGSQKISDEVLNTVILLAGKNRIPALGEVALAFQTLLDDEEGVTRGVVSSAQPLTPEAQQNLESKIAKVLNKKIILTYQQNPNLLGGMVAQVDGWTFDDSIETHLKKMNEELNRRAN